MARLGDAFDKLKKAASQHGGKVSAGIDKASRVAKEKTGGKYDQHIDRAGDAATEYLRRQARQERPTGPERRTEGRPDAPGTGERP
ncbi:antitoxin [Marinactinospora thermotolerans]|uniref:MT0933-like antitoxin protein n=1 Tax=Marinactinospora thermotolerans DSM 45154 TaxID=1122192 RepID=A0A1T4T9C5_9ACTN|nr:antitoxin [Marinactinospora thermotolerans]SKA36983.1 MT0933-like antitoxin protein [Marinactinospora thermotolerans DSM 45154]